MRNSILVYLTTNRISCCLNLPVLQYHYVTTIWTDHFQSCAFTITCQKHRLRQLFYFQKEHGVSGTGFVAETSYFCDYNALGKVHKPANSKCSVPSSEPSRIYISIFTTLSFYTGCNRRNGPDFGKVFLMLNYTDKPQNTYIQSWTVSEIMASEVWNSDSCYTLTANSYWNWQEYVVSVMLISVLFIKVTCEWQSH